MKKTARNVIRAPSQLWFVALAVLVVTAAFRPAPVAAQAPPAARMKALFLGDNGHHQPYQRAKEILPVLAANGVDMFYTDDPDDLNPAELDKYHALILYNNHEHVSNPQLNALLQFVDNGGGLIALHSSSASFQNSEEFTKLIGGAFKTHGTGTFTAVRTEPEHPAVQGVPTFESWDETYIHAKHNPVDRTVLEVRREGDHEEPWTWVRTYGDGRVFYTAWGHDERTWGNEGFQQLVLQGARWAAGDWTGEVQVAESLPTVDLPAPLPTYELPPAPWNTLSDPIYEGQVPLPMEESLELATVPEGFSIEEYASEPLIGRIIDFTWDERGRMWAAETNDYPNTLLDDDEEGGDRILILEDTDGDGQADDVKVFADGLNLVTSLVLINGGLVVAQAPHFFFLEDTDGDGQADVKEMIMTGWPRTDTHGTPSNFRYGFDNQVLGSVGYNGFRGTVGDRTYERGELAQGYFRFTPDGESLDYLARTSNNTWGVALTEDGYIFGSTANNRPSTFVHIPGRYYNALGMDRLPVLPGIEDRADIYPVIDILQVDQFGLYTAGAAHEVYTARAFPREYWNRRAFVADPTGHLIGMFDLQRNGSGFNAKNKWSFMASRDAWMAPVQVKVGPDGAIWVADFYSLVSQHNPTPEMEDCCEHGEGNAYETPNRDAERARIYRITHNDAAPYEPLRLDDATPAELVETLRHDNMFWRFTAQRLLVERGERDVVPDLIELVNDHRVDELGLNTAALHALWTLDGLGAIPEDPAALEAARNALYHPAASLRRAALMILPREPRLLEDVLEAGLLPNTDSPGGTEDAFFSYVLQDVDPSVRLEALLVLSELAPSERAVAAIETVLFGQENASDPWIPDAAAMAGAVQGPEFLQRVLAHELPEDSSAVAGIARAVGLMTLHHAQAADVGLAVALIEAVPDTDAAVGLALLEGLGEGWPEEESPSFSAEQRTALASAANSASDELSEAFSALAQHWGAADLFGAP